MAFDPTTATAFQATQSGGFDPSTATVFDSANALPVDNASAKPASFMENLSAGIGNIPALADMIVFGLPGQAASWVAQRGSELKSLAEGVSKEESQRRSKETKQEVHEALGNWMTPAQSFYQGITGTKPEETLVGKGAEQIGTGIQKMGEWLEQQTGGIVHRGDVESLADTVLLGLGVRGLGAVKRAATSKTNSVFSKIDWTKVPKDELRSGEPSVETVDSIIKGYAKKTGDSITETDVRTAMKPITRGMKDAELNAEQIAYDLMQRGASLKEVNAIRKKNPLVGAKLDELMAKREELMSGPTAEGVVQGEVLPPENIPQIEITGEGQAPDIKYLQTFNPVQAVKETIDLVKMNPELAKTVGVAGAGAVAGYTLAEENELLKSLYGAAGALAAKQAIAKGGLNAVDRGLGTLSTQLRNINQVLGDRVATFYEGTILRDTASAISKTDLWKQELIHLPKEQLNKLTSALFSGTRGGVEAVLREIGNTSLAKEYYNVRNVLNEVGTTLKDKGILKTWREDYYPRIVVDYQGLLDKLGVEAKDSLTKLLNEAEAKAVSKGEAFGDVERSAIIDTYLRSPQGRGGVGFLKGRKLGEISEDLLPYYANPIESLHTYVERAVREAAKADLFGKSLKVTDGKIDMEASLGELVNNEIREGRLTPEQAPEVAQLLRDRFQGGERGGNALIQGVKNVTNIALLANVVSAGRQLADVGAIYYKYGLPSTIQAVAQGLRGKNPVKASDFGLADHLMQEFVNQSHTARLLNTAFKASGFSKADLSMKTLDLNASLIKRGKEAATTKGQAKIAERWSKTLGPERTAQLLDDLRTGKLSDDVMATTFADLTRTQPVTMSEMPPAYAANPNGRFLWQLKTWQLKQYDLLRNDVYNQIKKGNVKEGMANLTRYAAGMLVSGVAVNTVVDWLLGKPIDFEESVPEQLLKTIGLSSYMLDQARNGKPATAVFGMAAPPVQWMDAIIKNDPSASRYIPVLGPLLYHHQFGGSEKAWVDRDKRLKREAKAEARALDPERFRAIEERRKARALEKGAQLRAQGVQ